MNIRKFELYLLPFLLLIVTLSILISCHDGRSVVDKKQGWQADEGLVDTLSNKNFSVNYFEDSIPLFELPDPLTVLKGSSVTDAETWNKTSRPAILQLFREFVYGIAPIGKPESMTFDVYDLKKDALAGLSTRKQVRINFSGKLEGPFMDILIYLPDNSESPVPLFLGLNFQGNHTINNDPEISITKSWLPNGRVGVVDNRTTEKARGIAASRWPVEEILKHGYGLATIYYGDIDPDFDDGFLNGVHGAFDQKGPRESNAWGSVSAWAWGLSRAMDYLQTDKDIDGTHIAVIGHSRLGKTSLWAGAQDDRFALVVSNCSGCGGAALSRRKYGETVGIINTSFPHWFCRNFKKYNNKEDELPVDQHMLIALMAPRPVYIASADRDLWADPHGEFLSAYYANPVYKLFGKKGIEVKGMPPLDTPVQDGYIGYHVRSGKHDLTLYDWNNYMDFADKHFR